VNRTGLDTSKEIYEDARMKRHALIVIFAVCSLFQAGRALGQSDDVVQRAAAAVKAEKYAEALDLIREAYRADPAPRWLYDMGVLHDHLAECDDAAFFYRAALWGKGVLPQDKDAVEARLATLEGECHFKKRHATAADRHARAARYMGLKLCALARGILTGIATPAEKTQLDQCQSN
jgi:tetratricopeptide (TPR) repeat protein